MGYGSIAGRARTDPSNPQAHAICDACGFRYNHVNLIWQKDWAGGSLINKRQLVCQNCLDVPQEQLRSISLAADPVPILNPRPENFLVAETDYRVTSAAPSSDRKTGLQVQMGSIRVTEDDGYRVAQQTGEPPGGLNVAPGTHLGVPPEAGSLSPGLPRGTHEVPLTGGLYGQNVDDWSNQSGSAVDWTSETGEDAYWLGS